MAIFSAELVLNHGKLRYSLGGNGNSRTGDIFPVVVDTFDIEAVVARALTADRRPCSDTDSATAGHTSAQQRKVQNAAGGIRRGRQLRRHLCGVHVDDLSGCGVDQSGGFSHIDGAGYGPDSETYIDSSVDIQLDGYTLDRSRLEASCGCGHFISADKKVGRPVKTGGVGG